MHPADRVAWIVETAKGVVEGRLDVREAAAAAELQVDQLADLLRHDRNDVPQREADAVAVRLRLFAEQVGDRASEAGDPEAHVALAEALARLAQVLR